MSDASGETSPAPPSAETPAADPLVDGERLVAIARAGLLLTLGLGQWVLIAMLGRPLMHDAARGAGAAAYTVFAIVLLLVFRRPRPATPLLRTVAHLSPAADTAFVTTVWVQHFILEGAFRPLLALLTFGALAAFAVLRPERSDKLRTLGLAAGGYVLLWCWYYLHAGG